jgi:hypothetical protein
MKKIAILLGLTGFLLAINSCAYQETMNDRNAEGWRLQNELNLEVEKGSKLQR